MLTDSRYVPRSAGRRSINLDVHEGEILAVRGATTVVVLQTTSRFRVEVQVYIRKSAFPMNADTWLSSIARPVTLQARNL